MESQEDNIDQEKGMKEPLLDHDHHPSKSIGGVSTLPFILVSEGFERAAYCGLMPNMIVYLMGAYGLSMATGSNIIFLWGAVTNFTPILGAFLADAYVGRFRMIGFGTLSSLLGMTLLWSTTIIPGVAPSYKDTAANSGTSSTPFQLFYLCISLSLMSLGSGGIRSSSLAFSADQLSNHGDDQSTKPDSSSAVASMFNWYYFSVTVSMLLALTCIVYLQDHMGWQVGFAIPVSLMLVSAVFFFMASPFYVKMKPTASAFTRLAQVVVAAWRNRHYKFSSDLTTESNFHVAKGSLKEVPTEKLRFLNKACIVKDHGQDLTEDGTAVDPWRLCTTDQVEELKAIMNIIPLWSTGIMLGVTAASHASFLVLQAKSMDRHVFTPSFEIPAASFATFALITLMLWLALYDRVIIPVGSKLMGKPVRLDVITRMGIGILLSAACMGVAGLVERTRRSTALLEAREGSSIKPMSALWLAPQLCLFGFAEGFASIAQIEFFYSEFPKSMSSISSNLYGLTVSVASVVASVIMSAVNIATKQGGKESWVCSNPDMCHYDYYYWLLAGISLLNYVYFLYCSKGYGEENRVPQEKNIHDQLIT